MGVADEERRVVEAPQVHRRLGQRGRGGVPGGETPPDGVAVRVAALPLVEVAGVAHGVVPEPAAALASAAVPGPAAEPADEGLPPGAGHELGPLPHLEDSLPSSAPPPPARRGADPIGPLRRRGHYPLPGLVRPGHKEAAAAALGEHLVRRGHRCIV